MNGEQIVCGDSVEKQLNLPVVNAVAEVPCRWLAQHRSINRLFEYRLRPKLWRHRCHVHGGEELLGKLEHHQRRVSLRSHRWCNINIRSARIGNRYVQDIPALSVHVAENVSRKWSVSIDPVGSVELSKLSANVGVYHLVKR